MAPRNSSACAVLLLRTRNTIPYRFPTSMNRGLSSGSMEMEHTATHRIVAQKWGAPVRLEMNHWADAQPMTSTSGLPASSLQNVQIICKRAKTSQAGQAPEIGLAAYPPLPLTSIPVGNSSFPALRYCCNRIPGRVLYNSTGTRNDVLDA